MIVEDVSMEWFLTEIERGVRIFKNLSFPETGSAKNYDLSNCTFENCFLFNDMTNINLFKTRFIKCNLKCVDFNNSNLSCAHITSCSLEGMSLKNANIDNLKFEENWYMGRQLSIEDLKWFTR